MISSALVVVSVILFIVVGIVALSAPLELRAFYDSSVHEIHTIGLVGSAIIMTIAALTAFPAELPAIACGGMYGFSSGFIVIWVSAMIGASVAFFVARNVDPAFLTTIVGHKIFEKIKKRSNEKNSVLTLFLVRLVPLFPFFIVNFAAGMSGMRYSSYLLATGAGIIPVALVTSAIGAGLLLMNSIIVLIVLSVVILGLFLVKNFNRASG